MVFRLNTENLREAEEKTESYWSPAYCPSASSSSYYYYGGDTELSGEASEEWKPGVGGNEVSEGRTEEAKRQNDEESLNWAKH
jgi:hypothetical protein